MSENIPHNCMCEVCGKDFDTATAKLREENNNLGSLVIDANQTIAKLREELELTNRVLDNRIKQLAHQQLSSPSMDNKVDFHSDWDGISPDKMDQQPSATTPDVDKWNWSVEYGDGEHGHIRIHDGEIPLTYDPEVFVEAHNQVLAQVSESLVKVLKKYGTQLGICNVWKRKPFSEKARNEWVACTCGLDAALTDTRKKT